LNGTAFIGDYGLLSRSGVAFDPVNSLRGRPTIIDSAANLKFLSDSLRFRYKNFKFEAALEAIGS
jgi:hypothetical protein